MRGKTISTGIAAIVFVSLLICACGRIAVVDAKEQSAAQQAQEELMADPGADVVTYEGKEGWSVKYHSKQFDLQESGSSVKFTYKDATPGANYDEFTYVPGKQPEEALAELTDTWGVDPISINRHEGLFPGTDDKWGFWRIYEDNDISRTAIAGEYNGGVLIMYSTMRLADGAGTTISDALAEIADSITYKSFEPQTMYSYVPGKYVMAYDEEIEDQVIHAEDVIILNEDHTGTLSFQDDVDIMWGSYELMCLWPNTGSYEYTIEGDSLMLNQDGMWLTFEKQE